MLNIYKNIEVSVAGGTAVVSVNKYRNARNPPDKGGCDDAIKVKDGLRQVAKDAWTRAGGSVAYMSAFVGKGSPWAIAGVLEAFGAHSDAFVKAYGGLKGGPLKRCADFLADDSMEWEQTLQAICDECIGLDCNGFVGNWLRVVEPNFRLTPDHRADEVRTKAKKYRTRVEDIEYWDVMCYTQNEHIAVVSEPASSSGRFWVCQSAGGGPRINEFAFLPTGTNTFRLGAPTKNDIGNNFYVISLW